MIPINLSTETESSQEAITSPVEQLSTQKPVPIEVKWNLPAWIMRDPSPRIDVPDDDID